MTGGSVGAAVSAWFGLLLRSVVALYRQGLTMPWIAPGVLALVAVPEFAQHVAEIKLGMFGSRAAALAVANDPLRWAFGYVKLSGLVLTFLAAARFWWTRREGARWWDLRNVDWGRFLLGVLLFGAPAPLVSFLAPVLGDRTTDILSWIVGIVTLPFALLMLAGLFGDGRPTLAEMWRRGWPALVILAILLPLAFAPAQLLHTYNHRWAFGAEPPVVWTLMAFDAVVVGLLAGLTGTAFYLGYAAFRDRIMGGADKDRS